MSSNREVDEYGLVKELDSSASDVSPATTARREESTMDLTSEMKPRERLNRRPSQSIKHLAMRQLSQNLIRIDSMAVLGSASVDSGGVGFRAKRPSLQPTILSEGVIVGDPDFQRKVSMHLSFDYAAKEAAAAAPVPATVAEPGAKGRRPLSLNLSSEENRGAPPLPESVRFAADLPKKERKVLSLHLDDEDKRGVSPEEDPDYVPPLVLPPGRRKPPPSLDLSGDNALPAAPPVEVAKKGRRPPLNLSLINEDEGDAAGNALADRVDNSLAANSAPPRVVAAKGGRRVNLTVPVDDDDYTPPENTLEDKSDRPKISPRGTFLLGDIRIGQEGITPSNRARSGESTPSAEAPVMRGMDFLEVRALGNGASGVVMEAIHVPTLTIVALKMLPVYSQEKFENLSRELVILHKNLAALSLVDNSLGGSKDEGDEGAVTKCPNLLSLYNAFVNVKNGMVCMVMEYMDGGSLEDLVKNGGCNEEHVLSDIARQALTGLAFLHQNKSVHRDIKPANILCSSSGIIKIADFGISKVMDSATGFAKTFVGTVIYMSPERITASSYSYSSDIWSFGLTLLAVANGSFPLRMGGGGGESTPNGPQWGGSGGYWGMIEAVCDNEPPTTGPEFSVEFSEFIKSCLRKNPDERGSAQQLLNHQFIDMHRCNSPGVSPPPTPQQVSPALSFADDYQEHHHQLSAALTTSTVKRVVTKDKEKRSTQEHTAATSTKSIESEHTDADASNPDLISIETIRTKHLENIVTKLIFRDQVDMERGRFEGGYNEKGKLMRKDSVLDEDPGNCTTIDDVDDLFGQSSARKGGVPTTTPRSAAIKRAAKGNSELIKSILMLQGDIEVDTPTAHARATLHAPMPKLTGPDLQKWQNLAMQLHLPLDNVISIVESKLKETLDLLRQEDASYVAQQEENSSPRGKLRRKGSDGQSSASPSTSRETIDVQAAGDSRGSIDAALISALEGSGDEVEGEEHGADEEFQRLPTHRIAKLNSSFQDSPASVRSDNSLLGSGVGAGGRDLNDIYSVAHSNTPTEEYGPCSSAFGVASWLLEGLSMPFCGK